MTHQNPGGWLAGDKVRVRGFLGDDHDVTIAGIAADGFFASHEADDGPFRQGERRPFRWNAVIGPATGKPYRPHSSTAVPRP